MTKKEIAKLVKKYRANDHSSFDIYAPTKKERNVIEPILNELKLDFKKWKYNGQIKGFEIKTK